MEGGRLVLGKGSTLTSYLSIFRCALFPHGRQEEHFGLSDSSLENGTAASLSTQHAPQLGSAGSRSRAWGGCHRHLLEAGDTQGRVITE